MEKKVENSFFNLTPEVILDATEKAGFFPTGEFTQLNSYENRVFDIKLDPSQKFQNIIAKFYRPGRWSKPCILEEHSFLADLNKAGIKAVAPISMQKINSTIILSENIFVSFFPKIRGRMPDELINDDLYKIGQLMAKVHNVGTQSKFKHRPHYTTDGINSFEGLGTLKKFIAPEVLNRYLEVAEDLLSVYEQEVSPIEFFRIHGDCHRGNLLHDGNEFFLVDFDDCVHGPAIQDFWMLLSGDTSQTTTQADSDLSDQIISEREQLIQGYETLREFPHHQWDWIPLMRAFRIINYACWIARRWNDPSFPKLFPQFNTYQYWAEEVEALEQIAWSINSDNT